MSQVAKLFVFFDEDAPILSQTVESEVAAPSPPTPVSVSVGGEARAGRRFGGSVLAPWQPVLFGGAWCDDVKDRLVEACSKKRSSKSEPHPLEVLRDVKKTRERISKKEVARLKREVAQLKVKNQDLEADAADRLKVAEKRIHQLEKSLNALAAEIERLNTHIRILKAWRPAMWKPAQERTAPPRIEEAESVAVAKPPAFGDYVLAGVPFAALSAVSALGTYYLIPEERRTWKFLGYTTSVSLLVAGVVAVANVSRKE